MPLNMEPNMAPDTEPNLDLHGDQPAHRSPIAGFDTRSPVGFGAPVPAAPVPGAVGYETRDANSAGVLIFLAILATTLVLVILFAWGLFRQYAVSINNKPPDSPFTGVREVPTAPTLQVTPRADLERILAEQQSKLETYGWVDRQAGTVRIPIERAMDLLAQKGLPVAAPGSARDSGAAGQSGANSTGKQASSDAGSGNTGVDSVGKERVPGIASAPAGSNAK